MNYSVADFSADFFGVFLRAWVFLAAPLAAMRESSRLMWLAFLRMMAEEPFARGDERLNTIPFPTCIFEITNSPSVMPFARAFAVAERMSFPKGPAARLG